MRAMTFSSGVAADTDDRADAKLKVPKNRVQFDLPPRSMDRLNVLKLKTEAASYAEVVKNALRLYEALIEETESGKQFFVRDDNGTLSPYRHVLLTSTGDEHPATGAHRCRSHRQRQIRPGDRRRGTPAWYDHQYRFHAGVSRASRPYRAPHRGRRSPGLTSPLWYSPRRRGRQCRVVARSGIGRHGRSRRGRPPTDPDRRVGHVFRRSDGWPGRYPRPRSGGSRRGPPLASGEWTPAPCMPAWPMSIRPQPRA